MSEDRTIRVGVGPDGSIAISVGPNTQWLWPDEAQQALRALDLALHPWGEPGAIPTEPGDYWWVSQEPEYTLNEPTAVVLYSHPDNGLEWDAIELNAVMSYRELTMYDQGTSQFRKRWIPEAPE